VSAIPGDGIGAAGGGEGTPAEVPEPMRVPAQGISAVPGEGRAPVAEDPAILAANLNVGTRLFASSVAFLFMAFVFAFFYLKAVNSNNNWRPHHISPAAGVGIAMLVCVLGATALLYYARRALASDSRGGWLGGVVVSLILGLAAAVIQIVQYTSYGFSPESGGYASVFVGWTVMFLIFWLGALYWMETLLAQTVRRAPEPIESELTRPLAVLGPSASACVVYLSLLAGLEIITYVLLYLIK
jgi:heme/copper-type cytochrome/quinol oxidase subunit 3